MNMDTDSPTTGQAKAASELTLCYLVCTKDASGRFLGAIMLTDHRARPEHFAYVLPVPVSPMQKILYGSTLEEHLRIDVIGQKLLQQIPKRPDIYFVGTQEMLGIRRITHAPTAFLSKREHSESESLSLLKFDSEESDRSVVGALLASLESSSVDLMEPFARIKDALKEAMKEKT